jgi:hypothetical protein
MGILDTGIIHLESTNVYRGDNQRFSLLLITPQDFLSQSRRRGRPRASRSKRIILIAHQTVSKHEGVFQKWISISTFFQQFTRLLIKLIVNTFSKGCVCAGIFV